MKNFKWFLLLLVMLPACREEMPPGILPSEKMQTIMWDMLQADALLDYTKTADTGFRVLPARLHYYDEVYRIHKVTRDQFSKSLDYYQARPEILKTLLDSMQAKGERMKQQDSSVKELLPLKIAD